MNDNNQNIVEQREEEEAQQQDQQQLWQQAHRKTCLDKRTLIATMDQVVLHIGRLPANHHLFSKLLFWKNGEENKEVVATVVQKWKQNEDIEQLQPAVAVSPLKQVFGFVSKSVSRALFGYDDIEHDFEWHEADDAAMMGNGDDDHDETTEDRYQKPVLNVELTAACLDAIQEGIINQKKDATAVLVLAQNSTPQDIANNTSWSTWSRNVASADTCQQNQIKSFLEGLPEWQMEFLLEVLVECKILHKVVRDNGEAFVLVVDDARKHPDSASLEVIVSLHQIAQAQANAERQIKMWTEQADVCARRAIQAKRKGNTKVALLELKKRKIKLERIESTQNSLLTLEQTKLALEDGESRRDILESLQSSAGTLKQLREQGAGDSERVDDVMVDLQSGLDELKEAATMDEFLDCLDEAELLEEFDEEDFGSTPPGKKKEEPKGSNVDDLLAELEQCSLSPDAYAQISGKDKDKETVTPAKEKKKPETLPKTPAGAG